MAMRELRRQNRAITEAEAREILTRADDGVLATVSEDGWPYAVPVNHVLIGDALYIHCALDGHKIANIAHDERVSYCAIASAQVVPEMLSTLYESAIVFGRAAMVTDKDEKCHVLKLLTERFCGQSEATDRQFEEHMKKYRDGDGTGVIRIAIERITGKAHRE